MSQPWPAVEIARMILAGFDDYRDHFQRITLGARQRFEQARWQDIQQAAAARIEAANDTRSRDWRAANSAGVEV